MASERTIIISGGGERPSVAGSLGAGVVGRRLEPLDEVAAEAGTATSIQADVSTVEAFAPWSTRSPNAT